MERPIKIDAKRTVIFALFGLFVFAGGAFAKSTKEIDSDVDAALELFQKEVFAAKEMLKKAKGVLVFPKVIKAGIGIGGEYGKGALRINGKTVDYYNTITGSVGFQLGGQVKSVFMLFMDDLPLQKFRMSEGWKAGVDASVALISVGAGGSIDTTKTDEPIIAFVLGQKGLMYNLNIEGSKYNKIKSS